MFELALVDCPVHTSLEISEWIPLYAELNTLHVCVVYVLPLVCIAEFLHFVACRSKLYLVLQVGAENVCAQLNVSCIVVGREVVADRTLTLET